MNKKEFAKEVDAIFANALTELNGMPLEPVNNWLGEEIERPLLYGAISERCMERQLEILKGRKRLTTFMSDLSIGEWFGIRGLFDTIKYAMTSWRNNVEYMAEFVLCVNWKAWEHDARQNAGWACLYSHLYDGISDLMYRYFENDETKTQYLFEYLD